MHTARESASSLVSISHAGDRLRTAIARFESPACVGLDPVLEKLPDAVRAAHHDPVKAIEAFCLGVLDSIAGSVAIVKPQSACFERYGAPGVAALRQVMVAAHERGMLVILDAKRGDIGVSAEHYAAATFGRPEQGRAISPRHAADYLTVNAYLGMDTVEPYLAEGGGGTGAHGVFVLVRTSNPGSDGVQSVKLVDGRTVAEMMADHVRELGSRPGMMGQSGLSCVGAVVGATKSSDARALRERMPNTPFLIPGYGAQGGTLEDIRPMLRAGSNAAGWGVVVNASRSVIFPSTVDEKADWRTAVTEAAKRFAEDLRGLRA